MFTDFYQNNGRKRILVVEDDPMNQFILASLLKEWDFLAEITGNGSIAIECLQEKTYDLILMDIEMPVMNGFETTCRIRQELKLNIPIIAVSSNSAPADIKMAYHCGVNEYIGKPFNPESLKKAIDQHLSCVESM